MDGKHWTNIASHLSTGSMSEQTHLAAAFYLSDMTATDIPRRINPELSPQGQSFRPSATSPGGEEAISLGRWLRRRKISGGGNIL